MTPNIDLFGQGSKYPDFYKSYKSINEIGNKNWKICASAKGDLNNDNLIDRVIILESNDSVYEKRTNDRWYFSRPRVLLIVFKNKYGRYNVALQHNTFILRHGEDARQEVYPLLTIQKNGVLTIHYDLWHDYPTYKFRFQKNDFYLIGANIYGVHGSVYSEEDINFSTKRFYQTSYLIGHEKDKNKNGKTIMLKTLKPLKLRDCKMPLTHKITSDYTI